MKPQNYFFLIFVLGFYHSVLFAQPQLSYIIPDIGTPNFATYVEFIAHVDSVKTFGEDGFYKHPSNIKILPLNRQDSNKLFIGPEVISWDGRVVGVHIFVNPALQPNSPNWDELDPEFIVPLVIRIGDKYSQSQKFYIVQPTDLSNAFASQERILGEGVLGKRSPRGAIIVSNANFASEEYTVSTKDCDPFYPRNQGYLPFALLATGTINAIGTTINVSGQEQHAGPGGGGGGGKYCYKGEQGTPCMGDVGGNGFTGGGGGGKNESNANTFQKSGEGTGSIPTSQYGSYSLNGILGGISTSYESAGGGTGHPFGSSGFGFNSSNNVQFDGGYGAGSGTLPNTAGGAGGNINNGAGNNNSGGKAHGNYMIVPLSGGSGGASGNPLGDGTAWVSSGNGGGGGGAISVYARELNGLNINANGGNGEISSFGSGSGGSGGNVIIGARIAKSLSNITLMGGIGGFKGSSGRIRLDIPLFANVTSDNFGSAELGISTDTTRFGSSHLVTLTGYATGIIEIYVSYRNSPGFELVSSFPNTGPFTQTIFLPRNENVYYISTVVKFNTFSSALYTATPEALITQSSWNIIEVKPAPQIQAISKKQIVFVEPCDSNVKYDTIYIKNRGGMDLIISSLAFDNSGRFSVVSLLSDTIPALDSVPVIIRITKPNQNINQIVDGDSLRIISNSFNEVNNNFAMYYEVILESISVTSSGLLDFGDINISQNSWSTISITNTGNKPIRIVRISYADKEFEVVPYSPSKSLPMTVQNGQSAIFEVLFTPSNIPLQYVDAVTIVVDYNGCQIETTVPVRGKGINPNIATLTLPYLHQVDPKERNYKIPIYLSANNLANVLTETDTLYMIVSVDAGLFSTKTVTNGTLEFVEKKGDFAYLHINVPNITLQNQQNEIVTEIVGDVLLGHSKKSILKFDSVLWNGIVIHRLINGEIDLFLCEDGGDRLLLGGTNFFALLQPNPASTSVSVEIQPREIGTHSLSIFDVSGKAILAPITFEPILQPNGIPSFQKTIDVSVFPIGMYNLVIQTPTNVFTYPMQIIR